MSKRRHKHEEHEEHVNHERWLVTYADMITLLMVLFIVLFAIGQTDLKKYKTLRHSLAKGFGGPNKMALLDGGNGVLDGGNSPVGLVPEEVAAKGALDALDRRSSAWKIEKTKLDQTKAALEKTLNTPTKDNANGKTDAQVGDSQIRITVDSRGLIISINSDVVLFEPGSAVLRTEGQTILDRIAPQLVGLPNMITVEGHTDNVPISGVYPSNWELSTARASSVLRLFIERDGLPAGRGSAAGFADQREVASNATAAGRTRNRRVEIVVVAAVSDPNIDTPGAEDLLKLAVAEQATAPTADESATDGQQTSASTTVPSIFAPITTIATIETTEAPLVTTPTLPSSDSPQDRPSTTAEPARASRGR